MRAIRFGVLAASLAGALGVAAQASAQTAPAEVSIPKPGPAGEPRTFKMTTPIAPGVATPDRLDTSIGVLNLTDGVPTAETADKIYDNLDRSRALQAYLLGLPMVSSAAARKTMRSFGPDNQTVLIWENLLDPKTVYLTANNNTVYSWVWTDTSKGPLVVEVPPGVLGPIIDFWTNWVGDLGITGPDKGKGGKYLILPPNYQGSIPDGHFVLRPSTFGTYTGFRSFLVNGSPRPGVEAVKKLFKVYHLNEAANPPAMRFVNMSGVPSNFVAPGDYSFWELLNEVIQEEPAEGSDRTTLGMFASIGIVKGKPFNPDERMKRILTDAADIGATTSRTLALRMRQREAFFYPNSNWRLPYFGGYKFEVAPGVANLNGAAFFFYFATGVTPAMEQKMVGQGSQYPWATLDSKGNPFDGGTTYRLRLPPNIPVKDFWSVIVYDTQTRSMLQTDQKAPGVSSQDEGVKTNADGSVDVWFGPKAPRGMEKNWVQTIPGKGWFMILRLYGPLEPWFDQTWRPGEIEMQP